MTKWVDKTTWRFLLVGVINTLVGSGVMFLAYNVFHQSYWFSSALNYIVGSIVSYFLNKYYTFQSKKKSGKEVLRFIINILLCYLVAYGLAKPLVKKLMAGQAQKVTENVAMLVGMVLFVVLNYCGQRYFVFKKNETQK